MRHPDRLHRPSWIPLIGLCLTLAAGSAVGENCQQQGEAAEARASRFTDQGDGTVADTRTSLIWKRCSEGQTWDGATCTGTASKQDWREALDLADGAAYAGRDDWRIPSLDELGTLVDRACTRPAIDLGIFPDTPAGVFWSSTRDASNPDYAWYVHFNDGHAAKGHQSRGAHARLVRGGD